MALLQGAGVRFVLLGPEHPGDAGAAYLPNIPEAVVALLATASIGAVWTACAPDFGVRSVIDRLGQVQPTVLIAVDRYRFNGQEHDRLDVVEQLRAAMPSLRAVVLVRSLHPQEPMPVGLDGPRASCTSHGGIVVEHLKSLGLCLDVRAGDRFLFHSSTSWMAWNYLVGGAARQHRRAGQRQSDLSVGRRVMAGRRPVPGHGGGHGVGVRQRMREGSRHRSRPAGDSGPAHRDPDRSPPTGGYLGVAAGAARITRPD